MATEIGSKAPEFTLKTKTADGVVDFSLKNNFGKKQTVLLFVPLAFTPVCTREFCTATEDYEDYSNLDAVVCGISVDSPFSLDAWAKASKMNISLLSDMNKEVIKAYDVLDDKLLGLGGVAMRSAFVINKDGIITYKWVAQKQDEFPNFEAIKEALKRKEPANNQA